MYRVVNVPQPTLLNSPPNARAGLLIEWSLVRIQPGEPNSFNDLE